MAEKPAATEPQQPAKKGFPKKTLGIVLGIALVQGAGFFAVFKFAGGKPETAHAEGTHAVEGEPAPVKPTAALAEVQLLKAFKVPNDKTGRMFIYDLDISVVVPADQKEKLTKLAEERGGEIADAVARIVRSANDQVLREDDLSVLRTQIAEMLADIVENKDVIRRVLITRLVPIPT